MRRPWRVVLIVLIVLGAAAAAVWFERGPISVRIMARAYDRAMGFETLKSLPDGLSVALCGSGSPMPDPTRAGPCTAIVAGQRLFIVDAGEGSVKNLALMGLPPARVQALFLTHFHSDHIADVGELMLQRWAGGAATSPLPVYGPTGVAEVIGGFIQAYSLDSGYRIAHHGPKVVPPGGFGATPRSFVLPPGGQTITLIDEPDLKVSAFAVDHGPVKPAVGYLFVYKGRRIVVSGDTAPSANLEAAARGADVLVHEGLQPKLVDVQRQAALRHERWNLAQILHDILAYHTTPEQAAAIAERAKVRVLLFTHVIPPLPLRVLDGPFLGDAPRIFHGRIIVGRDGTMVTLPAGSRDVRYSKRLHTLL